MAHLVDAEWDERQGRRLARLLKNARMRYRAGLEDVDFHLKRNLEKNHLMRLADCSWVEECRDLIITGPCGCGKSFLASMFGQQACIHGFPVSYWPAAKLFEQMKLCKADGSYLRELAIDIEYSEREAALTISSDAPLTKMRCSSRSTAA